MESSSQKITILDKYVKTSLKIQAIYLRTDDHHASALHTAPEILFCELNLYNNLHSITNGDRQFENGAFKGAIYC